HTAHLKPETPPEGRRFRNLNVCCLLAVRRDLLRRVGRDLLRRVLAGGGGRRGRRRLRAVLAVRGLVALGALRLVLPALREVLHEGVERLLLALGLERLLDRVLGLGERLLRRRRDLGDLEDVVAVLGLDRARERV